MTTTIVERRSRGVPPAVARPAGASCPVRRQVTDSARKAARRTLPGGREAAITTRRGRA